MWMQDYSCYAAQICLRQPTICPIIIMLFVYLLVAVPLVALNSSLIMTSEGADIFLVCIDTISGTFATGLNVSIEYTLQDGASKDI